MNGAQALIRTLVGCGVDVCFANPGTSEMHFVAALDDGARDARRAVPVRGRGDRRRRRLRAHGRPAGGHAAAPRARAWATGWPTCTTPAGPRTPVVNIVGDHATYHKRYDAPLESDIETRWPATCRAGCARRRAPTTSPPTRPTPWRPRAARPAQVATLILPGRRVVGRRRRAARPPAAASAAPPVARRRSIARRPQGAARRASRRHPARRGRRCASRPSVAASRDRRRDRRAAARRDVPGPARARRRPPARSSGSPTWPSSRARSSTGARHLVLADARVAGVVLRLPGQAERPGARRLRGARAGRAGRRRRRRARARWPSAVGAPAPRRRTQPAAAARAAWRRPHRRDGGRRVIGALLPEGAIVSDESNTSGAFAAGGDRGCAAARLAHADRRRDRPGPAAGRRRRRSPAPDRPVIALEADGSAMYTIQALWTQRAGRPRRHHGHLQQPPVRDPGHGAAAGRGSRRRGRRPQPARPVSAGARLHGPGHRDGRPGVQGHHRHGIRCPIGQGPSRTRPPPNRSRNPLTTRSAPRRPHGPYRPRAASSHWRCGPQRQ